MYIQNTFTLLSIESKLCKWKGTVGPELNLSEKTDPTSVNKNRDALSPDKPKTN